VDGHNVLVVDDDADIRALLVGVLTDEGYHAESAPNGKDALAILDRWRADAIILDLMMPVMDGWTFVERLREAGREIPIVILSAAGELGRHAARIGAADAIAKPFDIDTFLPRIALVTGGPSASAT
jgi:two-component system, chemotaxis family, chemotaxis protein CheY